MSELSFEQMLEDSVKTIRNGEIVQGTVIDVKDDEIILNIGYKADGIITKSEYSNDASLVLTDAVHVGDSMEAKVLKEFPYSVECKAQENWSIPAWIEQAQTNTIPGTEWLLFAKKSRKDPIVIMDAKVFLLGKMKKR